MSTGIWILLLFVAFGIGFAVGVVITALGLMPFAPRAGDDES